MPLYAYVCDACDAGFELLVGASDTPQCPACGSERLTRQVSRICREIKYPAIARENGISGQVIVQFVVSKDGDIKNAKVMRGIGGGCNEEALRVVNEMPRWKPGKHNGRAVPVTFTLPIKFVLQ